MHNWEAPFTGGHEPREQPVCIMRQGHFVFLPKVALLLAYPLLVLFALSVLFGGGVFEWTRRFVTLVRRFVSVDALLSIETLGRGRVVTFLDVLYRLRGKLLRVVV